MLKTKKRALLVGINEYGPFSLNECVNDVKSVESVLSRNDDGSINFACKKMIAPLGDRNKVTRTKLRKNIRDLFKKEAECVLFYFSGHGYENDLGGYLVTQDCEEHDEGVQMVEILTIVNESLADNTINEAIIILDCCHSGHFGEPLVLSKGISILAEGLSILAATRPHDVAIEEKGMGGVLTFLLVEALKGGASDVVGHVNIASAYSFIDNALDPWDQQPIFKCNISSFATLRQCMRKIDVPVLMELNNLFENVNSKFHLDPSFEEDKRAIQPEMLKEIKKHDPVFKVDRRSYKEKMKTRNRRNEKIMSILRKYLKQNIIIPVVPRMNKSHQHLYWAALASGYCELTKLGKYYWYIVNKLDNQEK